MATWAALTGTGAPSPVATTSQAELPVSATTPLSAHYPKGGESSSSACRSLLPPATEAIVGVLAQMTLAHARGTPKKGQPR